MKTIAIYNIKGGVGKTASAVNLSFLASLDGANTLLWDLDPQGAASFYCRIKAEVEGGGKKLIEGKSDIEEAVRGTDYENLDLLPADFSLRNLDAAFYKLRRSKKRLKKILNPFRVEYDLIILDCPVTISILADNIFNAVDYTLVPLIPTTLSVRTYRQLLAFCQKNKYAVNRIYAFFSMVDRHKKMHKELMAAVAGEFNGVLQSFIPYLAQIEKMGIHRAPVAVFAPRSVASKSYQNLWHKVQETMLSPV